MEDNEYDIEYLPQFKNLKISSKIYFNSKEFKYFPK